MASVSVYLDKRRIKYDGTYPLKFNISIGKGRDFLVALKISITENQWDGGEVIRHDNRRILNQYIRQKYNDIEVELLKLETSGEINTLPAVRIKDRIERVFSRSQNQSTAYLVREQFERYSRFIKAKTTKDMYAQTLIKISHFTDIDSLTFTEINQSWLKEFEQMLKKEGLSVNSISIHMRNLRTIFNDAINEEQIEQNYYPFRKFKIKNEKTPKRSLSVQELRTLRDYPCEPHARKYVDIFMLIFYLQGINIIDLCNLKEITKGRIEYRRAKTGRLYSIFVEPEAMEIIGRYKGKNYLLDILDIYGNYKDFAQRMNKNLKQIGGVSMGKQGKKTRNSLFPNLSTYYARHTWATIAASLDIPKETISAALGHNIGSEITSIYIDFDRRKIDEANRKVVDFIK